MCFLEKIFYNRTVCTVRAPHPVGLPECGVDAHILGILLIDDKGYSSCRRPRASVCGVRVVSVSYTRGLNYYSVFFRFESVKSPL